MAIDIATDVAELLGSGADFTRSAATYTSVSGSTTDSVNGIFFELQHEEDPDNGLDIMTGLYVVAATEFSNNSVRTPDDTVAISGLRTFDVTGVRERKAHVTLELRGAIQRGGR